MQKYAWNIEELKCKVKECGLKVILFGAGKIGMEALEELNDIVQNVTGIIDNDVKKQGTEVTYHGNVIKILSMEAAMELYDETTIIIITSSYYKEIEKQLETYKISKETIYNYQYRMLSEEEFKDNRFTKIIAARCEEAGDEFKLSEEKFVVPSVVMILSNRCTLRCESCSMMVPYCKEYFDVPVEKLIGQVENFLRGVDEIVSFSLTGGETLIYKDLDKLIYYLQKQDKIRYIFIPTNCVGNIRENILEALKCEKVHMQLSDYGYLTEMARKVEIFEENGIKFRINTEQTWIDFGKPYKRNKTDDLLQYEYMKCWVSGGCKVLYDGKYFACDRAARMYMMQIPEYDAAKDYVEIREKDSDEEIRQKIEEMLYRKTAKACDFCDAASEDAKVIPAGIQIGGRERSEYTIVKRVK